MGMQQGMMGPEEEEEEEPMNAAEEDAAAMDDEEAKLALRCDASWSAGPVRPAGRSQGERLPCPSMRAACGR
jgi:hypothetical protein